MHKNSQINRRKSEITPKPHFKHLWSAIFVFTIIVAGFLIYSNSFDCTFHLDDQQYIVNNGDLGSFSDVILNSPVKTRIVGMLTFSMNYIWDGLDVYGYHLINIFIHIFTSLAVMWLAFLLFNSPSMGKSVIKDKSLIAAFFCGLLFLTHPVQTQAVTYIIQRQTSLAAFFYILAACFYVKARLSGSQRGQVVFIVAVWISGVLAFFIKENTLSLPFALMLIEYMFLYRGRDDLKKPSLKINLILSFMMIIIVVFYAVVNKAQFFQVFPPVRTGTPPINTLNYLITQFAVVPVYFRLLVLPVGQNLDYDFPVYSSLLNIAPLLGLVFHAALIGSALWFAKRWRVLSFGILWIYITLSVESGFLPLKDLIFEHRLYLPMFGFVFAVSGILFSLESEKVRKFVIPGLIVLACLYSSLTYARNMVWKTPETLWSDVIKKSPNKARPLNNYGNLLLAEGRIDEAIEYFKKSLSVYPNSSDANYNMGIALSKMGNNKEAIKYLEKSVESYIFNPLALYALGNAYYTEGNWEKAANSYMRAVYVKKDFVQAEQNIQTALLFYGDQLMNEGKASLAVNYYEKILEYNPDFMVAFFRIANCYDSMKQFDKAAEYRKKAKELRDKNR